MSASAIITLAIVLVLAFAGGICGTLGYLRSRSPRPAAGELDRYTSERDRQLREVEDARKGPRVPLEGL